MPSYKEQAEDLKAKGNAAFSKGEIADAISLYSQGVVACDRAGDDSVMTVKTTLLSNRAMCYLKDPSTLNQCVEDCTDGLKLDPSDGGLRNKLLFRRAKARFLAYNLPMTSDIDKDQVLQDAAKDLLQVINADPKNKDANQLLTTVRAQHKAKATAVTPVSKALDGLIKKEESKEKLHQIKLLLGLMDNDLKNASMELGRIGGVDVLLEIVSKHTEHQDAKLTMMSIQCLSQAASHPAFARDYLADRQSTLNKLMNNDAMESDALILVMACTVRIILHADRDAPDQDISGSTKLDYDAILGVTKAALNRNFETENERNTIIRAVLDLVNTFSAGEDRDAMIRQSLGPGVVDPTLPIPKSKTEIHAFTPQELAAYRKRQGETKTRNEAWAFERALLLLTKGFPSILQATTSIKDHVVRRELVVTIGRLLAILDEEDKIKNAVKSYLASDDDDEEAKIVEVFDQEEKVAAEEVSKVSLGTMMERAAITCALLLSKKEMGSWALGSGWSTSGDELPALIESGDARAMALAAEVVSAAATIETSRHLVANMVDSGAMENLLKSDDRDIRSGAASAVAKLGMSDKAAQKDEGEVMGMLLAACDLLEDDKVAEPEDVGTKKTSKKDEKLRHFSSFATSSVERAVEMISYLISNTLVKEELAAGFAANPQSPVSALERLVKTADLPNAGESLTGFALATIFQNMAATNLQIRREGFEGREITMEQYDEMQKVGKTAEEKEVMESEQDPDSPAACHERVRKMASANVPRALVTLVEGSSEHTLEQIVLALNRMAEEQSVRGIMIQQGVLSECIKIEKNESPTDTDTMKKVTQLARHCIAKMLVTTNPKLLTSAQRLGSIRPLIQLVRDLKAKDLQKFEALLSLTNIAGSGDDAQNRIVSERGISTLHFAMFADHEMVRRAATEAMSNLIPHQAMMDHLAESENLKLFLAFATDCEDNYECARAAAGCLAMATQEQTIAEEFVGLEKFRPHMESLLECGRLEIMHRVFVLLHNLIAHGGKTRKKAEEDGFVAFCEAYVASYQSGTSEQLEFSDEERALLPVTADLAMRILKLADEDA